jgi:hypothetical protein
MSDPSPIELFHATNDADSATARKQVVDRDLVDQIRFRNIFYPEVQADFSARGGTALPAIWDSQRLVSGLAAIEKFLDALSAS